MQEITWKRREYQDPTRPWHCGKINPRGWKYDFVIYIKPWKTDEYRFLDYEHQLKFESKFPELSGISGSLAFCKGIAQKLVTKNRNNGKQRTKRLSAKAKQKAVKL